MNVWVKAVMGVEPPAEKVAGYRLTAFYQSETLEPRERRKSAPQAAPGGMRRAGCAGRALGVNRAGGFGSWCLFKMARREAKRTPSPKNLATREACTSKL